MADRQVYFQTKTEAEANRKIETFPIILNCTGVEYYHTPFKYESTRNDYGIVYVVNGNMDFYTEDKIISLSKGGFIIGPPHSNKTGFGTKGDFLNYYWLNFTGGRVESLIEKLGLEFNIPYEIGMHNEILDCFKKIFNEFLLNDKFFLLRSESLIITLLSEFARHINEPKIPYINTVQYIHKHYNEDISIKTLADMENLSYSHYHCVFKQATGMSPLQYINLQRINSACFYLSGTTYSISEIATIVGYNDQCYFSRIFKKSTGLSPQQYRKLKTK